MRRVGLTAKVTMLFALLGIATSLGLFSAVSGFDAVRTIDRQAFGSMALAGHAALLSGRVAQTALLSRFEEAVTPGAIAAALDALDGAVDLVDSARASLMSSLPDALREANPTLDARIRTFIAFQRDIVTMGREVSPKAALIEASAEAARENLRQIIQVTAQLADDLDRRAQIGAAEAGELAHALWLRVIAGAIGIPLIGGLLVIQLLRTQLTRPLRDLMAAIGAATATPTVIEVPHTRRSDEIGQLARTVRSLSEVRATLITHEAEADMAQRHRNQRTEDLARIAEAFEQRIGALLRDIADLSESLRAAQQDSAVRAQQVSQSTSTAAAAVDGAGFEARRITEAALRLEQVIGQINVEVRRVSETATAATRDAAGTSSLVQRLMETAGQIREVVGLIEAVARQTNLLALNATIEAARAGVHGRGFAVVASEVKTLAGQTAEATAQVVQRIAAVNAALSQASTAVSGIVASVGAVEQASTEISAMVASHAELVGSLGDTVGRISGVTGTAAGAMAEIAQANAQTVDQAGRGAQGACDLDERIAALQHEAEDFVRRLRAA